RGMVEGVGDDGVFLPEQRLEQAAIGIETGGIEDRILLAEIAGDLRLERPMKIARAADEPYGGHAEPMAVHRLLGGGDQRRMIGKTKIVIGAEVENLADLAVTRHPDVAFL